MYVLLLICNALCPQPLDESLEKPIREKHAGGAGEARKIGIFRGNKHGQHAFIIIHIHLLEMSGMRFGGEYFLWEMEMLLSSSLH